MKSNTVLHLDKSLPSVAWKMQLKESAIQVFTVQKVK